MLPRIQKIANEYKDRLIQIYGEDLAEVILYGSYARGDFHDESDIDFAIVLKRSEVNAMKEIPRTGDASMSLGLKYNVLLSTLPTSEEKLKTSLQGIYQSIRSEGIVI